ncbi:MAG: thioredoxin family protein [Hyphomicrobiales bacterium]
MTRIPTNMIPLGFKAPEFNLQDIPTGKNLSFADIKGKNGTVVVFICNHCPFVIHIIEELVKVGKEYINQGIGFVMINSNDVVSYPQDSPENMVKFAEENSFPFPYLFDETQEVAKLYDAVCTPDFNVFDHNDICVYRGQFDNSRPGNTEPINGKDLRAVLDLVAQHKEVPKSQKPSLGCNIKWK